MTFKTRQELTQSVFSELALVAGSSVQTYTQPIVEEYIQTSFDHLFKKRFWDALTLTTFHTLDGVVGVTTDSIVNLEDLTDIKWIREYPYAEGNRLPYFNDGIFNSDVLSYTGIVYGDAAFATKRVRFNPPESAIDIAVRARRKPVAFARDTDVIPMDHLLMKHMITASLLAVDGMNPGAQMKQEGFFEDRFDTLVSNEANQPIEKISNRFARAFTTSEG